MPYFTSILQQYTYILSDKITWATKSIYCRLCWDSKKSTDSLSCGRQKKMHFSRLYQFNKDGKMLVSALKH